MSTNLATILVGLGYDLSALEKGAPEAFQLINKQTLGMSAEMKRTSREGAESMRLIGESIGLHISRPVARILNQEFPALSQALSSILGAGVFGVLAIAGVELFDRITRGIEKARQAQEKFAEATIKSAQTFDDIMAGFEKAEKLHSLSGLDKKLFEIDSSVAEETRKKIDQLTKALEENAKAAAAASGWWVKFRADVGDVAHQMFSSSNDINTERIDAQLRTFTNKLHDLANEDGLHQTHKSAAAINEELAKAEQALLKLKADEGKTVVKPSVGLGAAPQTTLLVSPEEVAAQQRYVEGLRQLQQIQTAAGKDQASKEGEARFEADKKAIKDAQEEMKGWNQENNKAAEAWIKLNEEIDKAIKKVGEAALPESARRFKEFGPRPQVAPPSGAPMRSDELELMKLQAGTIDAQNESWKKAGEILNQIETPRQKYQAGLAVLNELEKQGRLDAEQLTLAHQLLDQEWLQSESRLHRLQVQLEKFLERSKDARDGVKAFFLQLQIEGSSDARFTFEILTRGLQGFEDETAKALTGAQTNWRQFFLSLDQMALKFLLTKGISEIFKLLSGTGLGKDLGLDKLFGGQDQAAAKQTIAATTMLTAAGMQISAANIMAASAGGGAGGALGGAGGILSAIIPGFASGTDYAPGGPAWVGENGPEVVNLPQGSSVTPSGSHRGMGSTHYHYYDNRGADMAAIQRLERMMPQIEERAVARSVASISEINKRTPH